MSALFLKIVNMSISASWLVLAVLLLRVALRKAPKWVRVLLWGFVAIRLIFPFSIESVLSLIPSAETIPPEIMMDWTPEISTGIASLDTVVNPIITQTFAPNPLSSANPLQIWIPVLGNLWFLGILAMLIYTAVSYMLLQRKVATAILLQKNIYQSEHVDSPFVLGIIRPRIYLPFRMDAEAMAHVIAHEEAHIQRKDHWWKPIGFVLLALHWFNPLMWLGYILLCRDIELACDEKVIQAMNNETKANYTQALVSCSVNRRKIAACPLAFGEVGVKERVKSVMNYRKPTFWIVVAAIISCIVVAVCFLTNPKTPQNDTPPLVLNTQPDGTSQFVATVLEVYDTYLLVAPDANTVAASSADRIEVSLRNLKSRPTVQVGDLILIEYDGYIQETYPARITNLYQVELLYFDSGPIETIYGNVKTYFQNTDGTWQTGGRNYKYRLVITGRMPDAAVETSFVYLSNLETISFKQAYLAAGLSSNSEDYFSVEDAILVEILSDRISEIVQEGSAENLLASLIVIDKYGKIVVLGGIDDAIGTAILAENIGDKFLKEPTGLIPVEAHQVLDIISNPADDQSGYTEKVTVYVQYVYHRYAVTGECVAGAGSPAVITFYRNADNSYTFKEFRQPNGGETYAEEVRAMFSERAATMILDGKLDTDTLEAECLAKVQQYISRN